MSKFFTFLLFFLCFTYSFSQCAMCKAVIEGGNKSIAEGVNDGITYLMIFPYILVGALAYLLIRHRKKINPKDL